MMINIALTKKRAQKLKVYWTKEIESLKAHEASIETKLTDKEAEITASTVSEVTDILTTNKEKILETLIDVVKERNKCELKLMKWY